MSFINKQRFLAELGKLLTFMYEDDRQLALEYYSRLFDEAEDEHALIQVLVSPTKQAVVVARAYSPNLGRLSVNSEIRTAPVDRDQDGVPDFIQAIEKVRAAALAAQPKSAVPAAEAEAEEDERVDENQMTLFAEEKPEPAAEASAEAGEPAGQPETAEKEQPESEAPSGEAGSPAEEPAPAEEPVPAEEPAPAEEPLAWRTADEKQPDASGEDIKYFTLPAEGEHDVPTAEGAADLDELSFNIENGAFKKHKRKAKPFALILFILLAIPLTIAAIAVLLVPALLFLALSVAAIICGVVVVTTVFRGNVVLFADIMVLLGGALVIFALGLLFLWTSIWFVGGAIVALVHGVAALCDKWCYKEVQDE